MAKKKHNIRGFFTGEKGQRTFNYAYSIGASIVILGALFKLLHLKGADLMLILGMGIEATIFFLSAFDEPAKDYKWENVFPVLDNPDAEPSDAPNFATGGGVAGGGTVIIGNLPASGEVSAQGEGVAAGTVVIGGGAPAEHVVAAGGAVASNVSAAASAVLSPESSAELSAATEKYVRQINEMSSQLAELQQITASLGEAQSSLLDSYNMLKGDEAGQTNYAEQMQALGRNLQGLNTIYEIQLKSVSSQLDTIDKVNAGLNNIRAMYENGSNDSYRIRQETERMTQTLAQLNNIYERMLQAMTVNMGFAPQRPQTFAQAPQQPYAQPFEQTPSQQGFAGQQPYQQR